MSRIRARPPSIARAELARILDPTLNMTTNPITTNPGPWQSFPAVHARRVFYSRRIGRALQQVVYNPYSGDWKITLYPLGYAGCDGARTLPGFRSAKAAMRAAESFQ